MEKKIIPFTPKECKQIKPIPVHDIAEEVFGDFDTPEEGQISQDEQYRGGFELIDYSFFYYKTIAKKPIPEKRGGKFIQIRNEERKTEYLVFSPSELSSFHANIVERFCFLKGIEGVYTTKKMDRYEIQDPEWLIIGGGKWSMDDNEKRLVLFDNSGVYGRFDSNGLRKKILDTGKLQGYEVKIIG